MLIDVDVSIVQLLADVRHTIFVQRLELLEHVCFPISRRGDSRRSRNDVHRAVGVLFQVGLVPPHVDSSTESTIQRSFIQNRSILDIITCETHNSNGCVLTSRQSVKVRQLNRPCLNHGLLRVGHQVEQGVDPIQLVVTDRTDSLLTHSALISVSGRLVMMRVRNQACDDTQDGERVNFHVSCLVTHISLVQSDEAVVFLVHIKVLDDALSNEIRKIFEAESKVVDVILFQQGSPVLAHDKGSDEAAAI